MSPDNVELAEQAVDAFNHDGWDGLIGFMAPDVEFREPPEQPGASVYRGVEEVRRGLGRWAEAWTEQWMATDRIVELDGDRVLVLHTQHVRGRDGVEVHQAAAAIVTVQDGRIVRMENYWSHEGGLEAAGLPE